MHAQKETSRQRRSLEQGIRQAAQDEEDEGEREEEEEGGGGGGEGGART
jgi:hypothetical protein